MNQDEKYMQRALELAKKGSRAVSPNPMVGAVIVKEKKIIGEGYHKFFGGPHAEVEAINSVHDQEDLKGATIYVTLEPCRHQGKTPPCWDLVNSVGIERVVVGSLDPIHGQIGGEFELLDEPIAEQCRDLNKFFFTCAQKKRPFITVKVAVSADGFIAGVNGEPIHITSPEQDKKVHQLRANHQAIMVGTNTLLNDNPQLNVRHIKGYDPLRVILDRELKIPLEAKVFKDSNVLIATRKWTSVTACPLSVQNRLKYFKERDIQVIESPEKKGQLDLVCLFEELAKRNIASVLVEPGPTLYQSLKKLNLIDELIVLKGQIKIKNGLKIEF